MWSGRSANDPNEVKGFRQGLRDLGYVEGQNIFVEYRFGEGSEDRLDEFAAEFVRLRMDVIVGLGIPAVLALRDTRTTVPIVALSGDLVADHIVGKHGAARRKYYRHQCHARPRLARIWRARDCNS